VVRAFEELAAAGFLEAVVGRGTFVSARDQYGYAPAPSGAELPWDTLVSRAARAEPLERLDRLGQQLTAGPVINLQKMQPDAALLPHDLLRRCVDHVLRTQGPRALGYSPPEGLPRLRQQIAAALARSGVPVRADDLIITSGSQQALDLLVRALVDPGDVFLVERATYAGMISALAAAGARVVCAPGDAEGPDPAALKRLGEGAKGLYLMPDCRNPTGEHISARRRPALVAWSRRAGVPIIEDDYAADIALDDGDMPPALRALDGEVLYVSTFSKKLIPSLRLGFVAAPPGLRERLVNLKYAMDICTGALDQLALAEFLERGYLRRHLDAVLPIYRARRAALTDALRAHLPPGVAVSTPRRGVSLWLGLPRAADVSAVFLEAQARGVLVTPGTLNSPRAGDARGLRLTWCAEPPERLAEGARRLGAAVRAVLARAGHGGRPTLDGI